MRSSRHRVKSPIGNKVKRGAELEGTPRTPRTLDCSPVRSICANGLQEQDDQSRQPVSRKPQNWSVAKQGFTIVSARNDDTPENPVAPRHQERSREQGVKAAELALSPICVNAITAGCDQQGVRNSGKKRFIDNTTKALNKHSVAPTVGTLRPDNVSLNYGCTDHFVSCPLSPECRASWLSGGPNVVIWNNAAFQPGSVVSDRFNSRNSSSYSSSSSASSSKWKILQSKAQGADFRKHFNETTANGGDRCPDSDCQVEDTTDADSQPAACGSAEVEGARDEFGDGIVQFDSSENRVRDHDSDIPSQFIAEIVCATKEEDGADIWSRCTDCPSGNSLNHCVARKVLFVPREIGLDQTVSSGPPLERGIPVKSSPSAESVEDEARLECRSVFAQEKAQKFDEDAVENHLFEAEKDEPPNELSKACQEAEACEVEVEEEVSMNAIEEEIQRLKKRLSELQLQKRRMYAEGRRGEGEEKANKGRAKMQANGRGKGAKIEAGRGGNKIGDLQGPGLSRRCASLGSSSLRSTGNSPATQRKKLACKDEAVQPRGLKRAGMRTNEGGAPPPPPPAGCGSTPPPPAEGRAPPPAAASPVSEKKNVFRRLSLSSAMATVPSPKPVPRFVSSRYSQPPTPDPPPSKKRHRASSTPKNPPTSTSSPSPLKKLTTIRNGYPSSSGFSTPHKSRSKTPLPLSSDLLPHATTTPPRSAPRVQGFKSTAALSECLESLVQDTKQFFKRYPRTNACSPARDVATAKSSCAHEAKTFRESQQGCSDKFPGRRMLQLETISSSKPFETPQKSSLKFVAGGDGLDSERRTLPRINTSRLVGLSPRDSGCVKWLPDRQKKQSFFAMEERDIDGRSNERAVEAN